MKGALRSVLGASFLFAFAAGAYAQSEGNLPGNTQVTGGTLATVKLKSANVLRKVTLTSSSGSNVDVNPADKIEGLTVASATVASGNASSGKWKASTASVDMQSKRATVDSLSGTTLSATALTGVTLPASSQTFKVAGKDVTGDFSKTPGLDLINVQAENVDVQKPTVEAAAVSLDTGKGPAATTSPDAGLRGDYFILRSNVHGFAVSGQALPGQAVAPAGSCFYVSKEADRTDPADSTKKQHVASGTFRTGRFPNGLFPPYGCPTSIKSINANESYDVLRETLNDADRLRYGLTGGILVAPFKFYSHTHNFNAGATVGPYIGYRVRDEPGSQSVFAFAVGATSATVKTNNADGTTTSSDHNGLSAAFAYLLEFKDVYSLGAVVGWDFFSKADQIPNSGKLWLGISLGTKIK
jgi:hypothetical protein